MDFRRAVVYSVLGLLLITSGFIGCKTSTGPGDGGTAGAGCWVTDQGGATAVKVNLTDGTILVNAPHFN